MNRNKLKTYAPQARRDFIQAVTDRAAIFGLTDKKIEPMTERGDVVMISGHPFPKAVGEKRKKLEARIKKFGFDQTMEAMAYTWFNRLVAVRFMELHGYLEHGYRVLSHPEGHAQPEILDHAQHVDLPGLNPQKVIELKLDGTKAEELYRMLLVGQCNALHKALPFLFKSIDDETELLLPDHLLHSDSLIRKLVNEIDDEDWQAVEIIGWLYQFYISEKKDEVIGKVVASEDIPAATQLFTPNWIVKYLVQNTLGRQWLATYPQSSLRQQLEYYIEPAEQTPEVQEQLKAITPTSLNPEELTLLDPACGSGHILVEAYDLFKAIYQERGYRAKDIPTLILQKNLFGLEIDDRAVQLAAFALMMKARADDRRIFESDVKPNVLAFVESKGMNAADITHALNSPILQEPTPPKETLFEEIEEDKAGLFSKKTMGVKGHVAQADVTALLELFENAKTFGSLIQVPPTLATVLPDIEKRLEDVLKHGNLTHALAHVLKPHLKQARILVRRYDAVIANPPYMGGKYMNAAVKSFAKTHYPNSKLDIYAVFIERAFDLANGVGAIGMVTMQSWMFLSSYKAMRERILTEKTILTMPHLGPRAFDTISGEVVTVTAFACLNQHVKKYRPTFLRLLDFDAEGKEAALRSQEMKHTEAAQDEFQAIPGSPISYWVSHRIRKLFRAGRSLGKIADPRLGMATTDNNQFLRLWHEVEFGRIGLGCGSLTEAKVSTLKWFPYNKGGTFRRWYGNDDYVVNYEDDGRDLKTVVKAKYRDKSYAQGFSDERWDRLIEIWVLKNQQFYFKPSVTWSYISASSFCVRRKDRGFIFDVGGSSAFFEEDDLNLYAGFLSSKVAFRLMTTLNPTLNFQVENIAALPILESAFQAIRSQINSLVGEALHLSKNDWDASEMSWSFSVSPLCEKNDTRWTVCKAFQKLTQRCDECRERLSAIEEENNRLFIKAYGLEEELAPEVPDDQITLYRPNREEDIKRLFSYAVGCMMGRYSLDKPGLMYAHSGNQGFDASNYKTFPADEDGIIPLTEFDWFADDVANRIEKFLATAWPTDHLDENLQFVADSLGPKKGESPRETIRRYLAADFFKHHLSMYKKRPIYWLFSSGKQRGFQALVYLHRYNEGTLARMRTEYVIPLLGKMSARLNHLTDDIAAASSSQHKKRLETEKATVTKQLAEVQAFDEKLRHYADQRITLDLDDGVKVNYGKFSDPEFGDILAEVKAITGGKEDE